MDNIIKILLFLFLVQISSPLLAQDKIDNYSFIKLYVINDKEEVLLVKWNNQWELLGDRYNDPLSIKEYLNKMASAIGIIIRDPKLCGMYTQRWTDSQSLTLMQYYKVKYDGGDLKIPADCSDIKWFSYKEALKVIPYQNMVNIMKEISKHPKKVIGAAFERYKDKEGEIHYITLEDWHTMN